MYNQLESIPNALILDTNVLIYLFDPDRDQDEVFRRLLGLLMDRRVRLIIPEQVKKEWDKHKRERNEQYLKDTKKSIQKHKDLASHFDLQQEKDDFLARLDQLEVMAIRQYRYTHGLRARNLNEFIENEYYTDIPTRNSNVDQNVVNMSLERKAPFFTNNNERGSKKTSKNEMADAIIFFTAYEYAKANKQGFENIYFITENDKDFTGNNGAELHENLKGFAEEGGLIFNNNLERVLDIIDPDKRSVFPEQTDIKEHLHSRNFTPCSNCKDEIHINADCYTKTSGRYPEGEYVLVCPHCNYKHHTGETPIHYYN